MKYVRLTPVSLPSLTDLGAALDLHASALKAGNLEAADRVVADYEKSLQPAERVIVVMVGMRGFRITDRWLQIPDDVATRILKTLGAKVEIRDEIRGDKSRS